ncbi:MAG: asparaginase [Rhodobacterales bacterium]|nr:asparaginase [Rhodobacterales bacterium]NCT12853.1 asparaginase [Rhodobacterales bacterium]
MAEAVDLVEVWRGNLLECVHRGHAVVCGADGAVTQAWGDPAALIYPRSSYKMIQALPLVESGYADALGLREDQLALCCASHQGAAIHTERVTRWLADLGLDESALRCGPQEPGDRAARDALIRAGQAPCQIHNNCSGKHAGFLSYTAHSGGDAEYIDPAHPLQAAIRQVFDEVTGETSPGQGIDGCSAPTSITSVAGLARAMAGFATAGGRHDARARAQVRLVDAMRAWPELVNGEGYACTELMRATGGRAAIKGGADGVYVAIIPDLGIGVALKILDGGERAKEAAIAALLIRLGVLDAAHPAALRLVGGPVRNRRGLEVGQMRAAAGLI